MDSTRIDQWLWAIRVYKSRSQATSACKAGRVRINGRPVKPATSIEVGDRVQAHKAGRDRDFEVVRLINKRVGAPVAATCFIDHTPPAPVDDLATDFASRERGAGRPTKRDRRQLDRLRGQRR